MECYYTVDSVGQGEVTEKKSRFIADIFPVNCEEEAFEHLEEIKKKHWDARHHCWAYIIGRNPAIERMSDDGEPAGTAGKPILEMIRGRNLTNVFVVVTRYFGGTLLGTGGLVRAYSSAVSDGLSHTVIISKIRGFKLKIMTEYTGYGKIQYIAAQKGITVLNTIYTDKVEMILLVPEDEERSLIKAVMEGTNGQAVTEKMEECWFAEMKDGVKIFEK